MPGITMAVANANAALKEARTPAVENALAYVASTGNSPSRRPHGGLSWIARAVAWDMTCDTGKAITAEEVQREIDAFQEAQEGVSFASGMMLKKFAAARQRPEVGTAPGQ